MGSVRGHTASDLAHELQGPAVPMIITLMFVQIVFGLLMPMIITLMGPLWSVDGDIVGPAEPIQDA